MGEGSTHFTVVALRPFRVVGSSYNLPRGADNTSFKRIWLHFECIRLVFAEVGPGGVKCIFFGHVRINSCWSFWRSPWPSSAYWPPWSHTNNTQQLPRYPPPAFLLAPTSWPLRTPGPTPTQLLPPIPPTHRTGRRPSQHPQPQRWSHQCPKSSHHLSWRRLPQHPSNGKQCSTGE